MKLSFESCRARLTCSPSLSCFILAGSLAASAQTGTAALVGDVTDAQKQVLPGATVTADASRHGRVPRFGDRRTRRLQVRQRAARPVQLKVELGGFKTAVIERVELQVDTFSAREHQPRSRRRL